MLPLQYTELKLPKWPYFILITLSLAYFILEMDQVITGKDYVILAIGAVLIIWSVFSLQRKKIIIDDHGITNRMLFKEIFIGWNEITFVDILVTSSGHGISLHWKFTKLYKTHYHLDFSYGRKNMHLLAQLIIAKLGGGLVSEKVKKFAENVNYSLLLN
jgi:hypothetical protein